MSVKRKKPRVRKHPKKKPSSKISIHLVNFILSVMLFIVIIAIGGYFLFFNDWKTDTKQITAEAKMEQKIKKFEQKEEELEKYFEEKTDEFDKIYLTQKEEEIILPKKTKIKQSKQINKIKKDIVSNKKAKLIIIIDDVTNKKQVKVLNNLPFIVNLSFLPPTSRHKNSAKIVSDLDNYMIHLPLQATSFKYEETNTLHIGDSLNKIDKRIKQLRTLYPKAKYINNHTGSKYTADLLSIDKLIKILKKYNFIFVDSRTTSKSVAKKVAKKYNMKIYNRNIFLDNKQDINYIQTQLKKAVSLAQKNGFAIAIGHPHKATIKALQQSNKILKDIELLYINDL
jgi:polysaccharide deacetylase 2 family uncharacterized protein YibQ